MRSLCLFKIQDYIHFAIIISQSWARDIPFIIFAISLYFCVLSTAHTHINISYGKKSSALAFSFEENILYLCVGRPNPWTMLQRSIVKNEHNESPQITNVNRTTTQSKNGAQTCNGLMKDKRTSRIYPKCCSSNSYSSSHSLWRCPLSFAYS